MIANRAVITGASGGIGRATALEFAKQFDASLLLVYGQNHRAAMDLAAQVGETGGEAEVLGCDLTAETQREKLVSHAFECLGTVDSWIHLAGLDVLTGPAAKWDFDTKLQRLMDIDVVASVRVCRELCAFWRRHARPGDPPKSLTLIGWDQATRGMEGDAGQRFGPVKAAVTAFGLSLAQEFAPQIRVNVVAPGWIKTAWGETTDSYWDRRARGQALMRRWGCPEDVAKAIAFVADPRQTFLTGQVIDVNGGFSRRFERDAPI